VIRDKQQQEHHHQSRLVTAIRTWLSGLPANVELMDYETEIMVLDAEARSIEDAVHCDVAIDRCRRELFKLRDARASVARSVPPLDEIYHAIDEHVLELASRGCPTMTIDNGRLRIKHPLDDGWSGGAAKDALAAMAWLDPDLFRDRLRTEIERIRETEIKKAVPVMTTQDRDRRLIEIAERILMTERCEEFYVGIAQDTYDMRVLRRDDASPLAVLHVQALTKQRARATA
jgi:hypothetical protein